jgi:hypothetical protein
LQINSENLNVFKNIFTLESAMIKLRSSLLVLVGIVGLVLYFSVRGLLTYSKNRTVEARSPSKVVIQKLDSPTNGNGGGRQWRASMGDIAASGVVVNCTEYANGQLSNVFILSDGIIITQSIVWPLSPSLLGTKEYETKARDAFESRVAIEPALLEFREIISEYGLDDAESKLYSGVWEIYTIRAQIRQLKRRFKEENILSYGVNSARVLADKDYEFSTIYNKSRLEQAVYYQHGKTRLEKLFGRFPDACFDRLMSIHVFWSPTDFNNP